MDPHDADIYSPGYWPSVSDLFISLFIATIAILAAVMFLLLPTANLIGARRVFNAVGGVELQQIKKPTNQLRKEVGWDELPTNNPESIVKALGEASDEVTRQFRRQRELLERIENGGSGAEIMRLTSENDRLNGVIAGLTNELQARDAQIAELRRQVQKPPGPDPQELENTIVDLRRQLNDKPPIIQIDEQRETYRFDSGSSIIPGTFSQGLLANEFPKLVSEILKRREQVDTLEIIGHTDGIPLTTSGNLDQRLPDLLGGDTAAQARLVAGSNNDLGLLRALAVKKEWTGFVGQHAERERLERIAVRCYSAGQTILPEPVDKPPREMFRNDNPAARRIEMRLTRLGR